MTREFTPPQRKTIPVQSPLTESTKQLRIPNIRSPPQKRFAHLPEIHTKEKDIPRKLTSLDDSPFHDKKRLVDQFYDLSAPGSSTPKNTGATPTITRTTTMEELSKVNKFDFLKEHPDYLDSSGLGAMKSHMRYTVRQTERDVSRTVKHRVDDSELEMQKTTLHFEAMQSEIRQLRQKLGLYISLLSEKSSKVDREYEKLESEITRLHKTLSVLDQYEQTVETSRSRMLEGKKKLQELNQIVQTTDELNRQERENYQVRRRWIVMTLFVLFLVYIWFF